MNATTTLILAALAGGATGAATTLLVRPDANAREPRAPELPAPKGDPRVSELEAQVAELAQALTDVRMELAAEPVQRVPVGEIDRAVERWLSANAAEAVAAAAADPPRVARQAEPAKRDLDAILAELDAPELSDGRWDELWRELKANGLVDGALAYFEGRVERDPSNPDLHVELATAYLGKLQTVGQGVEAGTLAGKADEAFDRALELDDHHWEARYTKAVSLSFWPPIFGKQNEAIQNFEILIDQQSALPPAKGHADAYLFLGNLYQQTGNAEKALQTWKSGAGLFPEHAALAQKLANTN
jgi:tetratricopeptide (TPR) repeat protein